MSSLTDQAATMLRDRRWRDAANLLAQIPDRDPSAEMQRRLAANLASLQQHRADVYETLMSARDGADRYSIEAARSGHPTIVCIRANGVRVELTQGPDPLAAVNAIVAQIKPALQRGETCALKGIGDGYLLNVLAQRPPKLFMDTAHVVYVIEPDAQLVLSCLMIHDYTGPQGPIEQLRFQWVVGETWREQMERLVFATLMLPVPEMIIGQSVHNTAIGEGINSVTQKLIAYDSSLRQEVEAYYASQGPREIAAAFGDPPPRKPRVMLITTRFSTVLQHSTRDAARGFERIGSDTRVMIEPEAHLRLNRPALRKALLDFKPDLVFQIDHLRHELDGMFPPSLPFACWIQDHLPNLTNTKAGATITANDFVLTDAVGTYVTTHGYPERQCMAMLKLTATQAANVGSSQSDGDDLVFVSNASHVPQTLADGLKAKSRPEICRLIDVATTQMIRMYADGECLPTYADVAEVLRESEIHAGIKLTDQSFADMARWLTHPFNDALYRQQAIGWAVEVAREMNLSLALYGNGWDAHPQFAEFARGAVSYGKELEDLTRRSRINLQIVPYLCLHQRLLDGLAAGGFFLVRSHPADAAPQALADLLESHFESDVRTLAQARASSPPPVRSRFESLVKASMPCLCPLGVEDPIHMIRLWQEARILDNADKVLPRLEEISFRDARSLRTSVERLLKDRDARESIASAQRDSVAQRFSYQAGMKRVVTWIGELLNASSRIRIAA